MASKLIKLETFGRKDFCMLCGGRETDELLYGVVYKLDKVVVHYFCLLLSTNVAQVGEDNQGILGFLPPDIIKSVTICAQITCTICHQNGANIRCAARRCLAVFHYPCGLKNGSSHKFSGKFLSFCPKHSKRQKIPRKVRDMIKGVQLECTVCFEDVKLDNSIIWAPCCQKNAFFHRRCLQRMANSFGSYTLKCPLCNNKKKFIDTLKENGIFIPEQDASWEAEPNAFGELLVRYNSCDAVVCLCRRGRNFSQNDLPTSSWRIILCTDCGSQGIHEKCLQTKFYTRWKCDICTGVGPSQSAGTSRGARRISSVMLSEPVVGSSSNNTRVDNESEHSEPVVESSLNKTSFDNEIEVLSSDSDVDIVSVEPYQSRSDSDVDIVSVEPYQSHSSGSSSSTTTRAKLTINNNYQLRRTTDEGCSNINIKREPVKRTRSSDTCSINDEIVHEEKVFVCNFGEKSCDGKELSDKEGTLVKRKRTQLAASTSKIEDMFSRSPSPEDSIIADLRDVKPHELCPILIIDSDDEKEKIISIDSSSDDDVYEVPSTLNSQIRVSVMKKKEKPTEQVPKNNYQTNLIKLQTRAKEAATQNIDGIMIGRIGSSEFRYVAPKDSLSDSQN